MTHPPLPPLPASPALSARAGLALCRPDPGQGSRGQSLARDGVVRTIREFFSSMLPVGEATPDVLASATLFAVLGHAPLAGAASGGAAAALGRKGWPGADYTPAARQRAARALEALSDVQRRLDREVRRWHKLAEKREATPSTAAAPGKAPRRTPGLGLPAPLDAIFGHLLAPAPVAVPGLRRPGREPGGAEKALTPQAALALVHRARRVCCVAAAALSHVAGAAAPGAVSVFVSARAAPGAAPCALLVLAPAGASSLGRARQQAQRFTQSYPDPSSLAPGAQEQRWLDCAARWAFAGASLALATTLEA